MKKSSKKNSKYRMISKFSQLLWILSILLIMLLGYFIYSSNVLPLKYFLIIIGICFVFLVLHGFFVLKKNTRLWLLILLNIVTLIFMCGEVFAITKISDMINFLRENLANHFETNFYNINLNKDYSY